MRLLLDMIWSEWYVYYEHVCLSVIKPQRCKIDYAVECYCRLTERQHSLQWWMHFVFVELFVFQWIHAETSRTHLVHFIENQIIIGNWMYFWTDGTWQYDLFGKWLKVHYCSFRGYQILMKGATNANISALIVKNVKEIQ